MMLAHTGDGHYAAEDEDLAGILLTDLSLTVAALDTRAESILSRSITGQAGAATTPRLPDEVISKLRNYSVSELNNRTVLLHLPRGRYMCRVVVLHPCNDLGGRTMLALYLYRDTDVREEINRFAAMHELSERERQTLFGIATGLTCKEIAEDLNLSPNTVKSFLRLMMVKIGVARRGELISKVLDHQHRRRTGSSSSRQDVTGYDA